MCRKCSIEFILSSEECFVIGDNWDCLDGGKSDVVFTVGSQDPY